MGWSAPASHDGVMTRHTTTRLVVVSLTAVVAIGAVFGTTLLSGTAVAARDQRPAAAEVKTAEKTPPTVRINLNRRAIASTKDTFDFRPGPDPGPDRRQVELPGVVRPARSRLHLQGVQARPVRRFYEDLDARQRLFNRSDYVGGLVGRVDETVTGTLTLPTAGRYVIAGFSDRLTKPIRFELSGPRQRRDAAEFDNTIIATSEGWGGDLTLPTTGTLRFKNKDSVPHTLWLQPVTEGTTQEEVRQWFEDNPDPQAPPSWFGPGPRLAMMPLDPGASETRDYADYAPGTYLAWEALGWEPAYPPTKLGIVQLQD